MKSTLCHIPNLEEPPKYGGSNDNDAPNTAKYGSPLWHSMKSAHSAPFAPFASSAPPIVPSAAPDPAVLPPCVPR